METVTVTVEIKDRSTFELLDQLDRMQILRIVRNADEPPAGKKLSERFAGCISGERAAELQKELTQMRGEWDRHTF
jgi:hypothetical protein